MFKLIILPIAKQDIADVANWYKTQQPELGKRFTAEIRNHVSLIKKNPEIAATRYDDVRTSVLDIFPYIIHYSINESSK